MSQALELQPSKGRHMLYSNLSAAYLQLGKHEAALQAAKASVDLAPKGFHMVGLGNQCIHMVEAHTSCGPTGSFLTVYSLTSMKRSCATC
jgi:hypothetical protein